ncbi:MAG: YggU family protein [Peptococcaceae bacterium]|nr:MAG: YggU family protein [Peptococcaceae bacterium]
MLDIREDKEGSVFKVRVQPRASRNELAGVFEGALRVRLTAPPVEGAANEACRTFLAERLGVPRSRVEVISGHTGRNKLVRVSNVNREQVLKLLSKENG